MMMTSPSLTRTTTGLTQPRWRRPCQAEVHLVVEVKKYNGTYIPGPVRATFLVETSDQGPTQYPFGESFLEDALLPMLMGVSE